MKRLNKIIIPTITAILLSIVFSNFMTYAAEKVMEDGTVFDAQFYAETYPDVVAAKGSSENAMWEHYVEFGRNEGRLPYANAQIQSVSQDDEIYNSLVSCLIDI